MSLPPLKPRSMVFDLFGDHLRYHGGQARTQALCELLEVFGVGEATARIVLTRMRREGWFDTRREGRQVVYSLTERTWRLLDDGRARIFERARAPWDQQWRMVIYTVAEPERAEREKLRRALYWLGFGPMAPSTWISPHDRLERVEAALTESPAVTAHLLTCRSRDRDTDLEMVGRCWDLGTLARDYQAFVDRLEDLHPARRLATMAGPDALRLRVELVSGYRHFPFRDPDLPPELLPKGWPGRRAHDLFQKAYRALAGPADRYVAGVLARHGD
ncbi:MAG: PaaX family transcriptional regulator [Acidimicrobiales bacterium]